MREKLKEAKRTNHLILNLLPGRACPHLTHPPASSKRDDYCHHNCSGGQFALLTTLNLGFDKCQCLFSLDPAETKVRRLFEFLSLKKF